MITEVKLPVLGLTMEEGTIIEWTRTVGDRIQVDDTLVVVETDKAATDVPSPASGILGKILVSEGETVPVHTPIAYLVDEETEIEGLAASAPAGPMTTEAPSGPPPATAATSASFTVPTGILTTISPSPPPSFPPQPAGRVFASPRARRKARELGIEVAIVPHDGPRVTEKDVLRAAAVTPSAPGVRTTPLAARLAAELGIDLARVRASEDLRIRAVDLVAAIAQLEESGELAGGPAPSGSVGPSASPIPRITTGEIRPLNRYRRVTAKRMAESWATAPQVTLTSRCDMTRAIELRNDLKTEAEARGSRLSFDALFVRAVATALTEFPEANARFVEGQGIALSAQVNVGVAVDLPGEGLIVPVVRDAQARGLLDIAAEVERLAALAREGRLGPDDYQGGTVTITNLGLLGVEAFTPILNLPEVVILGIGAIISTPTYVDGQLVPRQICTLSLVADHRVVDGAPAARVLARIRDIMEHPQLLEDPSRTS